jgi:hypothetical protein
MLTRLDQAVPSRKIPTTNRQLSVLLSARSWASYFTHAYDAFVNTMQGVSVVAKRRGFLDAGVKDNEILIFSELMDAKSLFLTANADTVYFVGFIDVSKGPIVFEAPPKVLGTLDDMWFRWVTDFGLPGPDRGTGGK